MRMILRRRQFKREMSLPKGSKILSVILYNGDEPQVYVAETDAPIDELYFLEEVTEGYGIEDDWRFINICVDKHGTGRHYFQSNVS